jgi:hypothetical protein
MPVAHLLSVRFAITRSTHFFECTLIAAESSFATSISSRLHPYSRLFGSEPKAWFRLAQGSQSLRWVPARFLAPAREVLKKCTTILRHIIGVEMFKLPFNPMVKGFLCYVCRSSLRIDLIMVMEPSAKTVKM